MLTYVLDTNFFFNLQIDSGFGENSRDVIENITHYAQRMRKSQVAHFYMPPKIIDEMLTFVDEKDDYVKAFLAEIAVKAPERTKIDFPAEVFYDLVDDVRKRSYRGLQIAEEELDKTAQHMLHQGQLNKIEYQKVVGENVSKLRERYRNATRVKFLDSVADLDLIVLAKELDGAVVSADEGVIKWARRFGVKEVFPQILKKQLDSLLLA